jgi:O-antigen ligase
MINLMYNRYTVLLVTVSLISILITLQDFGTLGLLFSLPIILYFSRLMGSINFLMTIFLVMCSGFFILPRIHITGAIDLNIFTVIFFLLLLITAIKVVLNKKPMNSFVLIFFLLPVVGIVALCIGITYGNNTFRAFFEYKPIMFYLSGIFPLFLFENENDVKIVFKAFIAISTIYLIMLLFQYALFELGILFLAGDIRTYGIKSSTRFLSGAQDALILSSFYFITKSIRYNKFHNHLLLALFILAIILSFSRHLWVSLVIGFIVILWFERNQFAKKIIANIYFLILAIILVFLILWKSGKIEHVFLRTNMIKVSAISTDTSLKWRVFENRKSWKAIKRSPIFGNGLGYRYHGNENFTNAQYYVHNVYLWILLKMGVLGLLAMIAFLFCCFIIIKKSMKNVFKYPSIDMMTKSYLAYVITSVASGVIKPNFIQSVASIVFIAVITGCLLSIENMECVGEKQF